MAVKSLDNQTEILTKISKGDHHAFKVLYDHYYNSIYAYALYLLKQDILAEELVQEAFLKLWLQGEKTSHILNPESFLVTIIRNQSLNQLRKMKLETSTSRNQASTWEESHNETEESIMLNDARAILNKGIAGLPKQQRLVYELCYQQGLKYEEAAKELGLSKDTVHSYMKLALKHLREFIAQNTDIAVLAIIFKLF